ncbi:hypothetical protein ACP0BX_001482 [Amphidinium carterae]
MYLSHAWIDKIVPITDSEKKLTNVVLAVLGASWLSGPELDDHHCQPLLLGPLRLWFLRVPSLLHPWLAIHTQLHGTIIDPPSVPHGHKEERSPSGEIIKRQSSRMAVAGVGEQRFTGFGIHASIGVSFAHCVTCQND